MTRTEFESLPSKKQKQYARKQYRIVRDCVIGDYWDRGDFDDCCGLRGTIHHCWEKGMGGAAPQWFTFQKENMKFWSLDLHYAYHNTPRDKWTDCMREEFEQAEAIKQKLIDEDRAFRQTQGEAC